MMLADTSVWIEHFRKGEPRLAERLTEDVILMHPWISGETGLRKPAEPKRHSFRPQCASFSEIREPA